jgi:branched-subunit amino acid transport protein
MSWIAIVGLGLGCYLLKAVGPLSHGRFKPSALLERALALIPPTLLAALVLTGIFTVGERLVVDLRAVGLVAAAVAIIARAPLALVVVLSAAVTGLLRAFL